MRRLHVAALGLLIATAACLEDTPSAVEPQLAVADAATGPAGEALYRVTVHNLTSGQPFTPPLAVVHRRSVGLFRIGEPASFEVQQIAENGNLDPMLDLAATNKHVKDFAVTFGPTLPPVLPGETVTFEVEARTGARYLSVIAMLVCTNDGFTGTDAIRLPGSVGTSTTIEAYGYDAGTEMNTEDWDDLVPPCGPLTGFDSMGAGTGTSNPALYEGGVVQMHPGIAGIADLDAGVHGWTGPVSRIEVERIG